jgi:sugar/nucleoside kinase (ribokinase family)
MPLQNPEKPELLCIGNALVDIFAPADEAVFAYFGLRAPVQHLGYDKISDLLAVLSDLSASSGGGAANVAKIAALLGISSAFIGTVGSLVSPDSLGHSGFLGSAGSLGSQGSAKTPEGTSGGSVESEGFVKSEGFGNRKPDHFAEIFERDLREAGVIPILSRGRAPTGVCFILQTPAGETRVAACPAAALELSEDDIGEELIRNAKAVVIDGFLLGREGLVNRVLELAEQYGTAVALDVGAAALAERRAGEIVRYCRDYPLILFMNEEEAVSFYRALNQNKRQQPAPEGPEKQEWYTQELFPFLRNLTRNELFPIIVVKLGPRGAVAFAGGAIFREETTPVIPLETTGAGDAFCAAFLAAWIRNRSIAECAALGNRAAREVLDVTGTRVNKKHLAHLAKLL